MPRTSLIALLALIAIFYAVLFSGCSSGPQDVNNTASNDTVPAFGHVYLDNKTVTGARIEAVSLDGSRVVMSRTNASGTYILNLAPGVSYNVTASFDGLNHTITPVYLPQGSKGQGGYDIILSRVHRSAISGAATADSLWKGKGVYIQAIPYNGSQDFVAVTGEDGSYTLDLVPDEYYYLSARSYQPDLQEWGGFVYYRNTVAIVKVNPRPDETVLIDYKVSIPSPGSAPVIISPTPKPTAQPTPVPGPVTASGHVYLDGQLVNGAQVEAVSSDGRDRVSATTNASGAYSLVIQSALQYKVTATYSGLKHSITPVYLHTPGMYYYDVADQYDINLSRKPASTLSGRANRYSYYTGMSTLLVALGSGGNWQTALIDNGTYSFNLKPGVSYTLGGNYTDHYGQSGFITFVYRNGDYCSSFTPKSDETILIDVQAMSTTPPKSLFWTIDNTSVMPRFLPPTNISILGRVYLDGRAVSNASVQAIAAESNLSATAFTDDSGAYTLGLMSKTLYRLVATYQGKQCILMPVFVKDNMTDVYDIYITSLPRQGMKCVWDNDVSNGAASGKITVQAVPVYGGTTVNKVFDGGEDFFLDLKPGVYYNVSGTFRDAAGRDGQVYFITRLGGSCQRMLVRPNETIPVYYYFR